LYICFELKEYVPNSTLLICRVGISAEEQRETTTLAARVG